MGRWIQSSSLDDFQSPQTGNEALSGGAWATIWMRFWAHRILNVAAKLLLKHQDARLAGAKTTCQIHTRRKAVLLYRQWAARCRDTVPEAVWCVEDLYEQLSFLDCPKRPLEESPHRQSYRESVQRDPEQGQAHIVIPEPQPAWTE